MTTRLTEKSIKKLIPPTTGSRIEWDTEIPGLGIRITANGVASFILDYRIARRHRRYTIGRCSELGVAEARRCAGELRQLIREGQDPMQERTRMRSEPTLADLTAQYLERHAEPKKRASSVRDDRYMIERVILPRLGKFQLRTVGRQDVESVHQSLKDKPYYANRVLSLLSKMFSLAMEWSWTTENPTRGIPRFQEENRERYFSVDEIRRLVGALDSYPDRNAANALKLLLFTGARVGEVLKAEWNQFDFENFEKGVWTKPRLNTKQNRVERVPLSEEATAVVLSMKPQSATGPLFPGKDGGTRVSLRRPWLQACKLAGLVSVESKPTNGQITRYRPTGRIHDLRHNFASHLVSEGASLHIVGRLLGHTQLATTMRYAHLQDGTLRDAVNQFGHIVKSAELASK